MSGLLGTCKEVKSASVIMQTKVPENSDHAGQSLHMDSGIDGLPTAFGFLDDDHDAPLSVLIPLTKSVQIDYSKVLTKHVCESTLHEVSDEARMLQPRDTITVEVGKMMVFTHDFVHAGARDSPNYRMFMALQHPMRPAHTGLVVVI